MNDEGLTMARGLTLKWLITACVAAGFLFGCNGAAPPLALPQDAENLIRIDAAYRSYLAKNGKPPQSESQVRDLLAAHGEPDQTLRSPEDGEPYVIIWGVDIRATPILRLPPPIIAHQKLGKFGRRHVLTVMGVHSLTDEEFARADFVSAKP